jgi:hypothetical protein
MASLTLLATLTTTSGTTQSATGLPTTYTNLLIVPEGVDNSTGTATLMTAASSNNGASYGASKGSGSSRPVYGASCIYRANASASTKSFNSNSPIVTTSAAPINALQFSWDTGYTFNAGTIYIYGWN